MCFYTSQNGGWGPRCVNVCPGSKVLVWIVPHSVLVCQYLQVGVCVWAYNAKWDSEQDFRWNKWKMLGKPTFWACFVKVKWFKSYQKNFGLRKLKWTGYIYISWAMKFSLLLLLLLMNFLKNEAKVRSIQCNEVISQWNLLIHAGIVAMIGPRKRWRRHSTCGVNAMYLTRNSSNRWKQHLLVSQNEWDASIR